MSEYGVYLAIAVLGTVLFVLKLLASFHGFDGDFDFDGDLDGQHSFEVFSIQSLLAFMMGVGWSGLAFHYEMQFGSWPTIFLASLFGVATVLFSSTLMYFSHKLNSSTPVAVPTKGLVGRTYLAIPLNGTGQVELTMGGKKQIIDAQSSEEIPSFTSVKVVEVVNNSLVKVEKV